MRTKNTAGQKHIVIVVANPRKNSLCCAIARACRKSMLKKGYMVAYHDLYPEKINPILPTKEYKKHAALPWILKKHCREAAEADGFIIVHL